MRKITKIIALFMLRTRGFFFFFVAFVFLSYHYVYTSWKGIEVDYMVYDFLSYHLHSGRLSSVKNIVNDDPEDISVVIIDIDERSLAVMSEEYGRWPWSRSVIAEFLLMLASYDIKSIGIDVLFSDRDINDPGGDEFLNEIAFSLPNIYFSSLVLDQSDAASGGFPGTMLPTLEESPEEHQGAVSILMPFMPSVIEGKKHGVTNFSHLQNDDGLVRHFPVYVEQDQIKVASLAFQLSKWRGHYPSDSDRILLNWESVSRNVKTVSFADIRDDLLLGTEGLGNVLNGSVVIIGSSAPGLFALKSTSIDTDTPGVLLLAAATENLVNQNWYLDASERVGQYVLGFLMLCALIVFVFDRQSGKLDTLFVVVQVAVVIVCGVVLIAFGHYSDATQAIGFALVFYAVCRAFAGIYHSQLREGWLLIESRRYPKADLLTGAYRFDCESDHEKFGDKVGRQLKRASPYLAFSKSIFDEEVGLLGQYALRGGIFYAVLPSGTGNSLQGELNLFFAKFSQNASCFVQIEAESLEHASYGDVRVALDKRMPSLLEFVHVGALTEDLPDDEERSN